jgi:hypothetical protein
MTGGKMGEFSLWHRIRRWIAYRIYPEIFEWYYGDELSNLGTIADALENKLAEKQMEVDYLRAQEEVIKDRLSHRDGLLKLCNAEKLLLAQSAAAWREKYYALERRDSFAEGETGGVEP